MLKQTTYIRIRCDVERAGSKNLVVDSLDPAYHKFYFYYNDHLLFIYLFMSFQ